MSLSFFKFRPALRFLLALALTTLIAGQSAHAQCCKAEPTSFRQPDGTLIDVHFHGNERYTRTTSADGYTLFFDHTSGAYFYAVLDAKGDAYVSNGRLAKNVKPADLTLGRNLELNPEARKKLIEKRSAELEAVRGDKDKWLQQKQMVEGHRAWKKNKEEAAEKRKNNKKDGAISGDASFEGTTDGQTTPDSEGPDPAPPVNPPTLGNVLGLTILVDFADVPARSDVTRADFDDYCNKPGGRVGWGNKGSIYDYFYTQSNGRLSYRNNVTYYVRVPNTFAYYNNTSVAQNSGTNGRKLLTDALNVLIAQGFDFSGLTANAQGRVIATNLLWAGNTSGVWASGLWPHRWSLSTPLNVGGGLSIFDYQCTNIGSSGNPTMGTFCHEDGHLIGKYPDYYDTNGGSEGVGNHCLMGAGNHATGTNPTNISSYLKFHSGWMDAVELNTLTPPIRLAASVDATIVYKYTNATAGWTNEYFLVENRSKIGGWESTSGLPDSGLMISHIHQTGSNQNEQRSEAQHYEHSIEQADGSFGLELGTNRGDANDYFHSSGTGPKTEFSDTTLPNAKWWQGAIAGDNTSGTNSGLHIHSVNAAGAIMSFVYGTGTPSGAAATRLTTSILENAVDYGSNAPNQTFAVYNSGGGTVNYSVTDNVNWLSVNTASGDATAETDSITVSYTSSALAAGTYTGTITVNGGAAGTQTIAVTLTVRNQSMLSVTPASLSIPGIAGLSGFTDIFDLKNTGGGTATYTITKTQSWLTVLPTSGTVSSERDTITATCSATSLAAGTYNDTITVTSAQASNSPLTIAITFTVQSAEMIVTSPNGGEQWSKGETKAITWVSSLGGNVKIELFKGGVFNSTIAASTPNTGSYSWTISGAQAAASDYTVKISSIETPAKTDTSNANFSILPTLADALDTTGLTWTTSGNANWLPQSATTQDGFDAAQSGDIADSQSTSVETTLVGPGTMTFWWKVSSEGGYDYLRFYLNGAEQAGAVAISGTAGTWVQNTVTVPAGSQTIKWTYSKDGSEDGGSDTAWVDQVVYTPSTAPEIAVEQPVATGLTDGTASINCGTVNLGSSSAPVTFTVRNTGTADLTGLSLSKTGTHNADYALGSLGATTLAPGASTTFTVTFTPGAAGSRSAAIQIASNDADENPFDISLTGTGVGPGTLAVGPAGNLTSSGIYGGPFSPSSLIYTLSNPGNSPIDWTATKTAGWVTLSSAGGTLAAGANTTVTVSLDANALAVGGYSDTVSFTNTTNSSGNTTRGVALTVTGIPATFNFSNLLQTYDGSPKSATVSTTPAGLAHSVTYGGSPTEPTNAGTYAVAATITEPNYSGSGSASLTIQKAAQTINFAALAPIADDQPPFALSATATSGLAVSYTSSNTAVATVSGSTVTLVGLGTTTITASQSGNTNYNAATSVPQILTVVRSNPLAVITGAPYKVLIGQTLSLNGSASQPSYGENITIYEWDLNNDNTFGDATGATPSAISFTTLTGTWGMVSGLNTIQLKVTDSANKTSIVSTTVELVLALTWDANGTTAGQTNGVGAWLGTNLWWDGAANQTWASGSNATFGGPSTAGGAVTLASPTSVNAITFNTFTGTYTLGTAGQTLTINGGITKNAGSGIVTIISPLNLGGAQTWTNISSTNLNLQAATTLTGVLTVGGTGTTSFDHANAIIGGAGGIIKNGTGQLNLSGGASPLHTFTGDIVVNGGSIGFQTSAFLTGRNVNLTNGFLGGRFGSGFTWSSGLGTGANQIQITGGTSGFSGEGSSGSTFVIGTALSTLKWGAPGENGATGFFNPTAFLANGDVRMNANGNGSLNNGIDLNGTTRTITSLQTTDGGAGSGFTISGVISNSSGTAGLIKTGVGNLILGNANTYNGDTTISGGTLQIGNNSAGSLGNGTYNSNISIAAGSSLRIFSTATQILGGTISGSGGLFKSYAGNLTLSGNNTYTGRTFLVPLTTAGAGTLSVSSFNSVTTNVGLGTVHSASSSLGAPTTPANGTIDFGSSTAQAGVTLKYTGNGETTDRVINFLFNGTGATKTLETSGAGLLKFTSTFTGSGSASNDITLTGSSNGEIVGGLPFAFRNFTKSGNGTWTLGGTSPFTGTTTITAGKLALGASDVLPNASAVSIANATLDAATFSDTLGTLDVTSASVINLGAGAALAFADSSAIDWAGGTLNVTGTFVPGSSLRFGTSSAGLTSVQIAKITVAGFSNLFLDANGYLTVDVTPPTLAGSSIVDDKSGGPVAINTLVTYTVTFSEDMDASTVTAAAFGNAGGALVTIGTVVETTPGVFTVPVTPTSTGSLQLRVNQNAVLKDVAGNNLDTASAIPDNTILTVDPASQTITFAALPPKVFGDTPLSLAATASSGLAVSYASSNETVATVSGSTVTIVGAGSATITASQAGNTNYAAAPSVPQTLTVAAASQTITFAALPPKVFGDAPLSLTATASSGLAVSYASSNETVATISGSTVTIVGAGSATITASQAGNINYAAAPSVPQTLTVAAASQTITFGALPGKTFGNAPFSLTGSASSSLTVSYASSNETVATISGSNVTIVGAGSATITASQAGNINYAAAPSVPQTLTVAAASQTITFAALPAKALGAAPFSLTGSASSGLAVSYASSNEAVATVSGSTVTIVGAGSTIITASQAGNINYAAAPSVPQTLTVDGTLPTLISIVDDKSGAPIPISTLVTYTVTFSEAMDTGTVAAADFGNAGTAALSIGTVIETSPGVFTVQATPTSAGTLQLRVNAAAILKDVPGNSLDTTAAIADDTTITVDGTAPTLASSAIVDNKSGAPITVNTLVTYTVTFSEDLDATTVTADDFGNAGSAALTIGAVIETAPGVFTVQATPTSGGTLQLRVNQNAVLKDVAGNNLDTALAISDDTILTVDGTAPTLASTAIVDNVSGGPIVVNTLVTYTVTFSEDMDASTVTAADFGNAGSSNIAIGTVTETAPGVFSIQFTPLSVGTLRLRVHPAAVLNDVAGNPLDTTAAIQDDTQINVISAYTAWSGGGAFGADANGDGFVNGMAWLLGATNPSANARGHFPTAIKEPGKRWMAFRCLKTANRGSAMLRVQFSDDLGQNDPWAANQTIVPDTDSIIGNVNFIVVPDVDPAFINVWAELPPGKRFGRLHATEN